MTEDLALQLLMNPAFYVTIAILAILAVWALIACFTILICKMMEMDEIMKSEPRAFGFRRIAPDGSRYQWWADGGWMDADEFEAYCGGILGMSRDSIESEFGSLQKPPVKPL